MSTAQRIWTIKYFESILLWSVGVIVLIAPILFISNYLESGMLRLFDYWRLIAPFIVLVIVNHYVLVPKIYVKNKFTYLICLLVLLTIFNVLLHYSRRLTLKERPRMEQGPMPNDGFKGSPPHMGNNHMPPMRDGERRRRMVDEEAPLRTSLPPVANTIIISLLIVGFDTGLRSNFRLSIAEQERQRLEKSKTETELAFLRHQISPHFFMNTLNNIHSLIDVNGEEAKEAIIRLSKIMRHLLYDSNNERVKIKREIELYKSYVDLMKLRFTDKVTISLNVDVEDDTIEIPPLLFTSLIENAFKYGVSYKEASFISIQLSSRKNELYFEVKNSMVLSQLSNIENDGKGGIGLENTRKRLELLYHDNYKMKVDEADNVFTVALTIPV